MYPLPCPLDQCPILYKSYKIVIFDVKYSKMKHVKSGTTVESHIVIIKIGHKDPITDRFFGELKIFYS